MDFSPGTRGFYAFCRAVDVELADFQKRIARAVFGSSREVFAVLPRGNAKSSLAALLAVHHVLTTPSPSVYVGAGSREQARVIGRMVERFARHPAVAARLLVRHDELRLGKSETVLQVVASDGSKAHGWERPTLMIGDEAWGWSDREPTLLGAMQTALVKNPDAKLLVISTSASSLDTQLGRMRARALTQPHTRDGAFLEATGELHWLEWSVPSIEDAADPSMVKAANPAPWISRDALIAQRSRVTEVEFLQFHCSIFGVGDSQWLPPGAWAACRGDCAGDDPVYLGIDIGGSRAASACIGVTAEMKVAEVAIFQGDGAVLEVTDKVLEIAARRSVVEVAFDPWRYQAEALRLERDHGVTVVEFGQSHSRMVAASENLHRLIVEGKLTHPGHPALDRHVAAAVAKQTPRGWRLDKLTKDAQIDGAVALAMACSRAEVKPEPVRLVGWV